MRIPYANIPTQAGRIITAPPVHPASKSADKRQILEAQDSYTRDGRPISAQVIDAEYVEFYTPSSKTFTQERQNLDLAIEGETSSQQTGSKTKLASQPAIDSYLAVNAEPPPPPGTYINIFA